MTQKGNHFFLKEGMVIAAYIFRRKLLKTCLLLFCRLLQFEEKQPTLFYVFFLLNTANLMV